MTHLTSPMFRWRPALVVAVSLILTGGTETPETSRAEVRGIECLICLELGGYHAFALDTGAFCEPGAGNNEDCAACGGTSLCHEEPDEGPCHVQCGQHLAFEDEQELMRAVEDGEVQSIIALMEKTGHTLALNVERSALQAKGCGDNIALHIPVSSELLTNLIAILGS